MMPKQYTAKYQALLNERALEARYRDATKAEKITMLDDALKSYFVDYKGGKGSLPWGLASSLLRRVGNDALKMLMESPSATAKERG